MSQVAKKLEELGFRATLELHDFVFNWEETSVTSEKVIELIDQVQKTLKGMNVGLHFVTD